MTIAVTKELPPDNLAIKVTAPSGYQNRWAEDEKLPENILSDIEISDEMPGGCKDMQGTLARNPQDTWGDLVPYSDLLVYQPGFEKIWHGFLDKTPDVSGDQMSISPSGIGWQSVLEDNQAVQIIFIDRDLSRWHDPSLQQRLNEIAASNVRYESPEVGGQGVGAAGPGIVFGFSTFGASQVEEGQVWYGDGTIDIDTIRFDFKNLNPTASPEGNVEWHAYPFASRADPYVAGVSGNDMHNTTFPEQAFGNNGPGIKYIGLNIYYGGGFAGEANASFGFLNIRVFGRHGIFTKGTWPLEGFTSNQLLLYLINNFAQPLTTKEELLDEDGFIIPHAAYPEPTSVATIAKDVTKYGLYDWFVYFNKQFQYRKPGSYGKFWKAYVGSSNLNELGEDSQRLWRSVVVQYTDVDGSTKSVGPPGSQANVESASLEVTDPDHPAVQANRTRRDILDLQGIGTPASAIAVGKRFLEEAALINRSGSATLSGYVMDDKGVFYPAACVKSGDWISFMDAADTSYRKIINKTYRHSERSSEIDLDAPASGLEALLERLQVGLIALGVS
jgi:hypothetical protein